MGRPARWRTAGGVRSPLLLLGLAALCAYAPPARGREAEYSGSPAYDLGEIVVTAPRMRPASSTVVEITAEDIRQAGARTVSEALLMVPGVTVSVGTKNEVAVQVRGINPASVLVLVDGRPVNMPYYGKVDLNAIPVDNVTKIKVTKGPSSLLYGVNGPAGVVNILTTRSSEQSDGLYVSTGANRTYRFLAETGGLFGPWDYHVTASRHRTDGYRLSTDFTPALSEDGGVRENSDFDRLNLTAKLGYRFSQQDEFALGLGFYRDEKGIPPPTRGREYRRFVDWKRYYVDGTAGVAVRPGCRLKAKAYYDAFVNELIDYKSSLYEPDQINWDSIHDNWDRGGMLQLQGQWRTHGLTVGANAKQEVINRKPDVDEPWETFEMITASLALQDVFSVPRTPLTLTGELGCSLMRCDDETDGHLYSWSVDGAAGANVFLGERSTLYASLGRYTRYPTMHELYSRDDGSVTVDSVVLEPEEALKAELGGEYQVRTHLKVRSALFRENYRNLIGRYSGGRYLGRFRNVWSAYSQGAECGLTWQWPRRHTTWQVDYTFTQARDETSDCWLPFIPKHKVDAHLATSLKWGVGAFFGAQWVGSRAQEQGPRLVGYFLAKARLSYQWRAISVGVVVDNVFDEDYSTEETDYPMPGRSIRLEMGLASGV